jgi:hypothetical protein
MLAYSKAVADRVVGYSTEGGFLSKRKVFTTRPMRDQLKAFLDHELLENKDP